VLTRPYEEALHESFVSALREAGAYFMSEGRLIETLRRLATRLRDEGIPYALLGGMALGEHGYVRMTEDVDVLLTPQGLEQFRERLVGRGYVGTHPGATRTFRDTESGVRIKVPVSGDYPGDGKPKAVSFPDPMVSAIEASPRPTACAISPTCRSSSRLSGSTPGSPISSTRASVKRFWISSKPYGTRASRHIGFA
jgi:hypothetical protein